MKLKILFWVSTLNLVGIFLFYILSFMTRNNHYAISIDTFFLASSVVLVVLALLLKSTKVISISLLSIVLAVGMNVFNISISYQNGLIVNSLNGVRDRYSYLGCTRRSQICDILSQYFVLKISHLTAIQKGVIFSSGEKSKLAGSLFSFC